ncbi:MAG: hypothetical protein AAGG48_18110 [Planctomycetota bacterium]
MSDDSSPWVPDKPPPNELSEEYLQEEIKSARNGLGAFLIAGFAVGRNIQVFSRQPGTAGLYLLVAWPLGAALCGFYLFGHAEKYGEIDKIHPAWLLALQGGLWALGALMTGWNAIFGKRIPDQELGKGFLFRHSSRLTKRAAGAASDLIIGLCLLGVLYALNSPVQARCYAAILGWLQLCHLCVFLRDWLFRIRLRETKQRARRWHKDVRGRHYV